MNQRQPPPDCGKAHAGAVRAGDMGVPEIPADAAVQRIRQRGDVRGAGAVHGLPRCVGIRSARHILHGERHAGACRQLPQGSQAGDIFAQPCVLPGAARGALAAPVAHNGMDHGDAHAQSRRRAQCGCLFPGEAPHGVRVIGGRHIEGQMAGRHGQSPCRQPSPEGFQGSRQTVVCCVESVK